MSQMESLELALKVAGFWPEGPEVESRTPEEWREVARDVLQELEGTRLVALVRVAAALWVGSMVTPASSPAQ